MIKTKFTTLRTRTLSSAPQLSISIPSSSASALVSLRIVSIVVVGPFRDEKDTGKTNPEAVLPLVLVLLLLQSSPSSSICPPPPPTTDTSSTTPLQRPSTHPLLIEGHFLIYLTVL